MGFLLRYLHRRFLNAVFQYRLGRTNRSAWIIFYISKLLCRYDIYENGGNVNRFDHYIPKLLLSRWRVQEEGPDKGSVFIWRKVDGHIEKAAIRRIAGEIDWDVTVANGVPSDFVSTKLFAELLEPRASKIIKRLNASSDEKLTLIEESTLAVFVGHQITRVPAFRHALLHFLAIGVTKNILDEQDLSSKEKLLQKVVFNSIGITYESFIEVKPQLRIEGAKNHLSLLALRIGDFLGERIYQSNLHILEIPEESDEEFVISDNPIAILDFKRGILLPFMPWWEIDSDHVWIFMPISRKKGIFYSKQRRKDSRVEKANRELVAVFNYAQYGYSHHAVFAQSREILNKHLALYRTELLQEGKSIERYLGKKRLKNPRNQ